MPYQLNMGDDGILRVAFIGDLSDEEVSAYTNGLVPLLEATSQDAPLLLLVDSSQAGKLTAEGREKFYALTNEPRIRKVAVWGAGRYGQLMMRFAARFLGRGHVRPFPTKEEALAWLQED